MTVLSRATRRTGGALLLVLGLLAAPPVGAQDTIPTQPLSLGDAARLAARRSASALEARYRAEQTAARVTQRRADLLPNFSAKALEAGNTLNTATFPFDLPGFDPKGEVVGPVNALDLRGRVSQTVLDFGAMGRLRSARTRASASDASARDAAEQAAATAALAYLRTQRAEAQIAAREADSVLADSLLGIARDQLAAGVGVALDVTRAEAQVASVRSQLIAARNERDRARLELLRVLALPLDASLQLADSLAALPIADTLPSESAAVALAMRQRPDLRSATEQLTAARQEVGAIRAERLPSLEVFGDEGWVGRNSGYKLNTYDWGVQVSLPIFDGLHREGRIQEQEAAAREIDVRLRDLQRQVAVEVRGALLDLASARQELDAARERLRLSEQEVAQARDRFRTGVAGNADVITASLNLNSSRTLLVDALTAYQQARVALARAEGAVTALP